MTSEEEIIRRMTEVGGTPVDPFSSERLLIVAGLMHRLLRIPDVTVLLFQRKEGPVVTLLAEYSPERHVLRAVSFYRFDYAPNNKSNP